MPLTVVNHCGRSESRRCCGAEKQRCRAIFPPCKRLPDWLPDAVRLYLDHTEDGLSYRALARRDGRHASTVMRTVRRYETRRDDPLLDEALTALAQGGAVAAHNSTKRMTTHDRRHSPFQILLPMRKQLTRRASASCAVW